MHSTFHEGVEYRFYDHLYAVSRDGLVLRKLIPWIPVIRRDGYTNIGRRLLHRMIATCWLDKPPEAKHVHHIDENRSNNHANNLEWLTPKQHLVDRHGGLIGKYERTAETREKLRRCRLGRKHTEETKQKQREASLRLGSSPPRPAIGHKVSDDTREKLRVHCACSVKCQVNGTVYRSMTEAARAMGLKRLTIRRRFLSNNFPDYRILS